MHRGLPWSCSGLVASTDAGSCSSSGLGSAGSNVKEPVRDVDIQHNAWGAKCDIMHDREQLDHLNPYKLLTKLPLVFLVF
jgi:anaerobic glycerol-3-phosphate dehydrogenase